MRKLVQEATNLSSLVAVIGASNDSDKFGYKIYRDLKNKGFTVLPINPNHNEIQGDKAYPSVIKAPFQIDIVNIVVPPDVALEVIKEIKTASLDPMPTIWLQPGSESEEIIEYARKNGLPLVYGRCIMTESGKHTHV